MTQRDLNRAVARATGESVECIEQIGFTLIVVPSRLRRKGRYPRHALDYRPSTGRPYSALNGVMRQAR